MSISLCLVFIFLIMGCASQEKKLIEKVDVAAEQLRHLSSYKEMQCEVKLKFAEPTKSAWLQQIPKNNRYSLPGGGAKLFNTLEPQIYDWRITPYRCRVTGRRTGELPEDVKLVLSDSEKKLDSILCIWMQSFYADSPLRGWRKTEKKLELDEIPNGVRITKGYQRDLEIYNDGQQIVAHMGGDGSSLTGQYQTLGDKLYPQMIEQKNQSQANRLQDFVYQHQGGREIPSVFWLNLANEKGLPTAYFQVQVDSCQIR